jgi:hypothetical protein
LVTIAALAGGWWAERMHQRQKALQTIKAAGGECTTEYESPLALFLPRDALAGPRQRTWRERLFGDCQRGVLLFHDDDISAGTLDAITSIREVRSLGFHRTRLDDDGLERLRGLRKVQYLNLCGCQITDRSAPVLADFQDLQWLDIDDTQFTDAAVPQLAKLPKLQVLHLQGTKITDRGFAQLGSLANLSEISIGDSKHHPMPVSVRCRDEVQRRLPKCVIYGTFRQ